MLTLFAIGTFWFWALLVIESIVLLALIENEKVGWGTISFLGTLTVMYFFGGVDLLAFVKENGLFVLVAGLGYFAAGTCWSIGKWWFFVRNARDQYDELKRAFLERKGVDGLAVPDNLKAEWRGYLAQSSEYTRRYELGRDGDLRHNGSVMPKARDHKGRILTWMTYWPWSMLWTLINDPIKKLFRAIYLRIQVLFEKIAASAFRGTEDDLTPAAENDKK